MNLFLFRHVAYAHIQHFLITYISVSYSKEGWWKNFRIWLGLSAYSIPTAQAGYDILGLHLYLICCVMLGKTNKSNSKRFNRVLNQFRGTWRTLQRVRQYPLVTIPFRAFQHLIQISEQKACLDCVYRHLLRDGLLILDVFRPSLPRLTDTGYLMEMEVIPPIELSDGRIFSRTNRTKAFHPSEQYNDIEFIYYITYPDGRRERWFIPSRCGIFTGMRLSIYWIYVDLTL